MKTIMYIALFAFVASIPKAFNGGLNLNSYQQEIPKTKVDSAIVLATKFEKKIDKKIMKKISNTNSKIDSLEEVVRLQKIEIRKYKKLLRNGK